MSHAFGPVVPILRMFEPAPGGREMQLIDPFSNRLRFFERAE